MGLVDVTAPLVSEVALLLVRQVRLLAVGAVTTVVAHVQPGFGTETAVTRVKEDAGRILRVVAHIVEAVQVAILRLVACIETACVQCFHRDDTRTAVLQTAHIARLTVTAATRQTLVTVRTSPAILVAHRVVFVGGAVGQQSGLSA